MPVNEGVSRRSIYREQSLSWGVYAMEEDICVGDDVVAICEERMGWRF